MLPKRGIVGIASWLECEQPAAIAGVEIERFQQILDRRIVGTVTDEDNLKARKQRLHKMGRPAIGQISATEVGAGDNELLIARA